MSTFQVPLVISSTKITVREFWNAVLLYHTRPHLVNKKILAASQVLFYNVDFPNRDFHQFTELFTRSAVIYEIRKLKSVTKENISEEFIRHIVECYCKNVELRKQDPHEVYESHSGIYLSVRILFPRTKLCEQCVEIVFLNKDRNIAHFFAVTELNKLPCAPPFHYEIELNDSFCLRINLNTFEDADTPSAEWLANGLFPKLLKWSQQEEASTVKTLSLIAVSEYSLVYNRLKIYFADDLIKKWPSKMGTDPQKHVFEDIAIASYLMCLWKPYNKSDVNFVDCGCGNGLLVYLLNQEGYSGYGIDIRQRSIWDIYGKNTVLKVATVTPDTTFPNSTWIIGNHSDELTPWIPVMALRSSKKANFFVLPCCPYDFSGQKYIRENTSVSQYSDYMDYIKKISKICGFETKVDKLRIPSTKNICFVGYANDIIDKGTKAKEIEEFIKKRSENKFTARNKLEQVRNCTQLDKNLINKIVYHIVQQLLNETNLVKKSDGEEEWNKGTSKSILSICQSLAQEDLKQLKNECGGLQTLLRNHRYLFIVGKGSVELRLPYTFSEVGEKYRSKPCWYFRNHQNGCLLTAKDCAYMH